MRVSVNCFPKILFIFFGFFLSGYTNAQQASLEYKPDTIGIFGTVPPFSLQDQSGAAAGLENFHGKIWVVSFISTGCKDPCPFNTSKMAVLNKQLRASNNTSHIQLVSISIRPEQDTSEKLSAYIQGSRLDTTQWKFLTGERKDIHALVKQGFGLPVAENIRNNEASILKDPYFMLIDARGRIRGYYDALSDERFNQLLEDLKTISRQLLPIPADVFKPQWVRQRQQEQLASAESVDVFHDFTFSDRSVESGIAFRHKIVDDIGANWKAVHYDHGNAIAVADVDLDGLYDIYFSTQAGSNELWRNKGDGKFENITKRAGLFLDDRIGVGASFADIDNDGDPDLYITSVREGNSLFENNGKGFFKNITKHSGTGLKAHSSGAIFFDYNRDGLLDLFVSNVGVYTSNLREKATILTEEGQIVSDYSYYVGFKDAFAGHLKPERAEMSVLYKNMGNNRFKDVSSEVELEDTSWSGDISVIDGNGDAWPDLYVLNMQGNDEYYENIEGKRFERKSREVFPKTPWGAMGIKSFDFDNDGDFDLYVTDMHSDMGEDLLGDREKGKSPQPYPTSFLKSGGASLFGNAFYRNDGNGKFSEISDQLGAETFWPWGISSADLNADGYEDVFMTTSMNYPFRYAPNSLLLNNKGKGFLDSEYILGVEPRKNNVTAAPWFELNCSGRNATHVLCQKKTGKKEVWGSLGSRSSVVYDLDMDGDLDIVTLELNQPPMVLTSNLSDRKKLNYLKINLVGKQSNKSGIGAIVKVYTNNDVYTKIHDGKSGYLSQSLQPLYFGLGKNTSVDKIEVLWPSGKQQLVSKNIRLNKLLVISEMKAKGN